MTEHRLASLRRLSRGPASRVALTATIVLGCAVVALSVIDIDELVATAMAADPRLLIGAAVVYAVSWPIRGRRYADILEAMGHPIGVRFLTGTVFLSQTANLLVPARAGDGMRAYLIRQRADVPYSLGVASLAVERVFDLCTIGLLGLLAAGWLGTRHRFDAVAVAGRPGTAIVVGTSIVLVGGSVATIGLARSNRAIGPALHDRCAGTRWAPCVSPLVSFGNGIRTVAANPRAIAVIGAGSVGAWIFDVLSALVVLGAVHWSAAIDLSLWALVAVGTLAVCAGNAAKSLPLTHGGIGLYEGAFAAVLAGLSPISMGTAVLVAVLDHGIKNAVTVLGGGVSSLALGIAPSVLTRTASDDG